MRLIEKLIALQQTERAEGVAAALGSNANDPAHSGGAGFGQTQYRPNLQGGWDRFENGMPAERTVPNLQHGWDSYANGQLVGRTVGDGIGGYLQTVGGWPPFPGRHGG